MAGRRVHEIKFQVYPQKLPNEILYTLSFDGRGEEGWFTKKELMKAMSSFVSEITTEKVREEKRKEFFKKLEKKR